MNYIKQFNTSFFLLLILLSLVLSCDFKPEHSLHIYKGDEPVLDLDITGFEGKTLHLEGINFGSRFSVSRNYLDSFLAKSYLSINPNEVVRIYVTDISSDPEIKTKHGNTFYRFLYFGIRITGDLTNGLSEQNIDAFGSAEKLLGKSLDSIQVVDSHLNQLKSEIPFNYTEYQDYKSNFTQNFTSQILNAHFTIETARLTIYNTCAKKELISIYQFSELFKAKNLSTYFDVNFLEEIRRHIPIGLPIFGLGEQFSTDYLSDPFKQDVFFTKQIPDTEIKILIDSGWDLKEEALALEMEIKKLFGERVKIKPVAFYNLFDYNTLFSGGDLHHEILFSKKQPDPYILSKLRLTVLDNQNRVLFNTEDNEHLMSQIEGILAALPINEEVQ